MGKAEVGRLFDIPREVYGRTWRLMLLEKFLVRYGVTEFLAGCSKDGRSTDGRSKDASGPSRPPPVRLLLQRLPGD
jgi:hypothetical protein